MTEMGRYCKAYLAGQLRQYPGWKERLQGLRQPDPEEPKSKAGPRTGLEDDDIVYLQESYVVTDGVFKDEHVIFDGVTDEWKAFCREKLGFEEPEDVAAMRAEQAGSGEAE